MKTHEVDKALHQKFVTQDQRLVFWHDAEGEFADHIAEGLPQELGGAQLLDVARLGGLAIKLRLETEDTEGEYLVYSWGERSNEWAVREVLLNALAHRECQEATSTAHSKRLQKEQAKLEKQRGELERFDEKLRHYADKRIGLDLDDGVKVNYGKFGDLLAEVVKVHGTKPEGL